MSSEIKRRPTRFARRTAGFVILNTRNSISFRHRTLCSIGHSTGYPLVLHGWSPPIEHGVLCFCIGGTTIMADEMWADVKGYEGLYLVSNQGRIMRKSNSPTSKSGKMMKLHVVSNGYHTVSLTKNGKGKPLFVHSLVLTAFLGDRPNGYQCNHKNGIRNDNRIENLEWVTPSDNLKHSFRVLGRKGSNGVRYGADHHNTKLTIGDIPRIRTMLEQGESMREIGRVFGVHWSTIRSIRDNQTWRNA